MKYTSVFIIAMLALMFSFVGCSKGPKNKADADKFGTNRLQTVFAVADQPTKNVIEKAQTAIKSEDFGAAFDLLQGLLKQKTLTSEQTEAIRGSLDVLAAFPRRAP